MRRYELLLLTAFAALLMLFSRGCKENNPAGPKDDTLPTVSITSPSNNDAVMDTVFVRVQATDNTGVTKVEFYIDGVLVLTKGSAPWEYRWSTKGLKIGSAHTLIAMAYDAFGNVGTSSTITVVIRDVTIPAVSILSPTNNAVLSDTVMITVQATDDVGVTKVEFYIDGAIAYSKSSAPWEYTWLPSNLVPLSYHTIVARAYDAAGNIGTSPTIRVVIQHLSSGTPGATTGVYIVNEGNFQRGNSSLTVYLPDSNKAYQDVFALANGRNLGDTGSDIVVHSGKAYIVVSGSQKIEVVSLADYKSVGTLTIPGKRGPYKLTILNDAKAFVTNISDASITEFNPSTLQITADRIKVGNNPMGITGSNGKVYVCNSGFGYDSTVTVLNATTGGLIKTVVVGDSPSEIGVGPNNEVIVKCDGRSDYSNPANDTPGSILKINSDNDVVTTKATLALATYGHPGRMTISNKGIGFFQARTGIIKFSYSGTDLSIGGTPFATVTGYGLAYDDATDKLYVTDAKDYVRPGSIGIYDTNGNLLIQFAAGVIPGAIAFGH